jgi:hypothetical protein
VSLSEPSHPNLAKFWLTNDCLHRAGVGRYLTRRSMNEVTIARKQETSSQWF